MSTTHKHFFLFLLFLSFSGSCLARVEKPNRADKPSIKFFRIGEEEKKRAPLAFSHKKKPLVGKERRELRKVCKSFIKKPLKDMNEKELRKAADMTLRLDWYDDGLRFLERLKTITKSSKVVRQVTLEIADINFDRGALKLSAEGYEKFLRLYPGDKQAEYAQYKGLLSNFYAMLEADRDQTATHNTIKLADAFLAKNDRYKDYAGDVKSIKLSCYERLYDHEVTVFEYYLKKGSHQAAKTRLTAIKKTYNAMLPEVQPKTLHLEYRLAQAQGATEEAQKLHYKLASRFPSYSTKMAINTTGKPKKNYVSFF